MGFSEGNTRPLKEEIVDKSQAEAFSLNDSDLLTLAQCTQVIEQHYQRPVDIEWAKDGISQEIFIFQARPETVHSHAHAHAGFLYQLGQDGAVLCEGRAVGKRIGQGRARLFMDISEAPRF